MKLPPPERRVFWGRLHKAGRKRVCTAAERAPSSAETGPGAVLERRCLQLCWERCARQVPAAGRGCLRAKVWVLSSLNRGRRASPALVKTIFLRFIPLSHQTCREQTLLFLLRKNHTGTVLLLLPRGDSGQVHPSSTTLISQ